MLTVIDTNVLIRLANADDPQHEVANEAVTSLAASGHELRLVPQSVYEFWVVATRPNDPQSNGLGLDAERAGRLLDSFEAIFPLLNDVPTLYRDWRDLVERFDVKGKKAHDARLAAAMSGVNATHLLTFNERDFARYPHLTVINPTVCPTTPSDGDTNG